MSPVRRVSSPRLLTQTAPGERPPGAWRYSSHLALVLSGGGARGAYHVGVLAGLAERLPGLEFPILTGMSVGAINTIYLAATLAPCPLPSLAWGANGAVSRATRSTGWGPSASYAPPCAGRCRALPGRRAIPVPC